MQESTAAAQSVLAEPLRAEGAAVSPAGARRDLLLARLELLRHMTVRSLRAQYKQSVLGYSWMVLNPLTQLLTLTFVFTVVFPANSWDIPFPLFLSVALMPWIFHSTAVTSASESLVGSSNLIRAVYFPREIVVISTILTRAIDFLVAIPVVGGLMIAYHHTPTWTFAWVPLIFLLQFLFTLGLSLPLAAMNLYLRDIRHLVTVVMNLWFFFTPIFYSPDSVTRFKWVYDLNPMARFVGAYRAALLTDDGLPLTSVLLATLIALGALGLGYYLFRKMEPTFADRV